MFDKKLYDNEYHRTHRKQIQDYRRKYYILNREHILKEAREYCTKNKERILKRNSIYRRENRTRLSRLSQEYKKNRCKRDIEYRLREGLRVSIRSRMYQYKIAKSNTTIALLGCSMPFFKKYIENRFKKGMSWDNRSKWHIDHIKPLKSFNLSIPEEQKACFHYTNLQPLWSGDNLSKGCKII